MARGRPRIGLPEGPKGLLPAGGGTQRMVLRVGRGRALDLCIRGRMIDADHAERIGLISESVDADQLSARGDALATELPELPQMTLRAIKRCILRGSDVDLLSGLRIEEDEMTALGETKERAREYAPSSKNEHRSSRTNERRHEGARGIRLCNGRGARSSGGGRARNAWRQGRSGPPGRGRRRASTQSRRRRDRATVDRRGAAGQRAGRAAAARVECG